MSLTTTKDPQKYQNFSEDFIKSFDDFIRDKYGEREITPTLPNSLATVDRNIAEFAKIADFLKSKSRIFKIEISHIVASNFDLEDIVFELKEDLFNEDPYFIYGDDIAAFDFGTQKGVILPKKYVCIAIRIPEINFTQSKHKEFLLEARARYKHTHEPSVKCTWIYIPFSLILQIKFQVAKPRF